MLIYKAQIIQETHVNIAHFITQKCHWCSEFLLKVLISRVDLDTFDIFKEEFLFCFW